MPSVCTERNRSLLSSSKWTKSRQIREVILLNWVRVGDQIHNDPNWSYSRVHCKFIKIKCQIKKTHNFSIACISCRVPGCLSFLDLCNGLVNASNRVPLFIPLYNDSKNWAVNKLTKWFSSHEDDGEPQGSSNGFGHKPVDHKLSKMRQFFFGFMSFRLIIFGYLLKANLNKPM